MSLYTWGLGKNGQLGTGQPETAHTPQSVTKMIQNGKFEAVKNVRCGALFTAVLCKNGDIFTAGCGKYGRLGQSESDKDCCLMGPVSSSSKFLKIACGSWHASAVSKNGELYIWGYSKACGEVAAASETTAIKLPVPVSFPDSMKIAGVSCGHNFTYAWTAEGQIFSWGRGQNGVLGHGLETDVSKPKLVESLADQKIANVGAGHSHCGIVTENGQLFMTGRGCDGALGLGKSHMKDALTPKQCILEGSVISVSCSKGEHHSHTLALTKEGRVFAWGDGYKGKLGIGDQEMRYTPVLIPQEHFNSDVVVCISAGGIHSAASTANGNVYTWGCGSDGRLGHPEGQGHRYLFRSDIPKKVEGLPKSGGGPAFVSCSYYHTAAVL